MMNSISLCILFYPDPGKKIKSKIMDPAGSNGSFIGEQFHYTSERTKFFKIFRTKDLENKPCINNGEQRDHNTDKKFIEAAPEGADHDQYEPTCHSYRAAGLKN
jgi:hypothetical protein